MLLLVMHLYVIVLLLYRIDCLHLILQKLLGFL
nr:MAG TPA: hypothetical protein [Caudoviricetes sp.]